MHAKNSDTGLTVNKIRLSVRLKHQCCDFNLLINQNEYECFLYHGIKLIPGAEPLVTRAIGKAHTSKF